METYTVSALKYRPQTFQEVVGQKNITETLENAIEKNQLAQALLFLWTPRGRQNLLCSNSGQKNKQSRQERFK